MTKSFRFSRLAFAIVTTTSVALGCLHAPAPPETWNFRILYEEAFVGLPYAPVGNTGIYASWMFDNPGVVVGSDQTISGYTRPDGYLYAQNGRVPARWSITVTTGHCAAQGAERNLNQGTTASALCDIVPSGFYSTNSYGYLANWIPSEYWDVQSELVTPIAGDSNTMSESANQNLYVDDDVWSPNGQFRLTYQGDGNLVLYDGNTPLWATGTNQGNPGWTSMQGDGNLVVYNGSSQPVWSSGTAGENGAYLAVMDNGSLILFRSDGVPLWWSNSGY